MFGRNLLDERYHVLVGQNDFGQIKTRAAPLELGLRLGWQY